MAEDYDLNYSDVVEWLEIHVDKPVVIAFQAEFGPTPYEPIPGPPPASQLRRKKKSR